MSPEEIARMLAEANATAGTQAVNNINSDGEVKNPNITTEPVGVQPDADGITRGTPQPIKTPEEILAEMAIEDAVEPDAVPAPDAEIDLTGKTLEEQLEILQDAIKAKELKENPLAQVEDKAKEAGVNVSEFEQEYINNGSLSEESLKSLKDAGFDEVAIGAYIETKEAQVQARSNQIIANTVGTREEYTKMADWMNENLTEAQVASYDNNVSIDDGKHAEAYIQSMYSVYQKANPTVTPQTILRNDGNQRLSGQNNDTFSSQSEMMQAMQSPRYKNDYAYRRNVINKVARMG